MSVLPWKPWPWSRVIGSVSPPVSPPVDPPINLRMTPGRVRPTYRGRVELTRHRFTDLALAIAVTAAGVAEVLVPLESRQGDGSLATSLIACLVAGLALVVRRQHPLPVAALALGIWPVVWLASPPYVMFFGQFVPMGVALYSVARHGQGRAPAHGAALGAATLLFVDLFVDELQDASEIIFHWSVFAIVWGFGFGLARWERRARESAAAAAAEERGRIARELHDIVAQAVSMMVVQAGAAEQTVDDDPELTRRALGTIRETGVAALAEMRRLVAVLREADAKGELHPQPGLSVVPALIDDCRSSGLRATLEVTGERRELPAGVDLAAYRIVQEALTNTRRHARASQVSVVVAYAPDEVAIDVVDDGIGADDARGGHGMVGMRERAALYGGRVDARTVNGSGFAVRAVLPTGPSR